MFNIYLRGDLRNKINLCVYLTAYVVNKTRKFKKKNYYFEFNLTDRIISWIIYNSRRKIKLTKILR